MNGWAMICYVIYIMFIMNIIALFESSGFWVLGSGLWWQLRCKIYICSEAATTISNFSFLIQTRLSNEIKGRPAPMATLEPIIFHNIF